MVIYDPLTLKLRHNFCELWYIQYKANRTVHRTMHRPGNDTHTLQMSRPVSGLDVYFYKLLEMEVHGPPIRKSICEGSHYSLEQLCLHAMKK
jgi:hypothetical protein